MFVHSAERERKTAATILYCIHRGFHSTIFLTLKAFISGVESNETVTQVELCTHQNTPWNEYLGLWRQTTRINLDNIIITLSSVGHSEKHHSARYVRRDVCMFV